MIKYKESVRMYKTKNSSHGIEWVKVIKFNASTVWRNINGEAKHHKRKSGGYVWHKTKTKAIDYLLGIALARKVEVDLEQHKLKVSITKLKKMRDSHNGRF